VIVNEALRLSPGLHDLYARIGRPSIPPEQLLRAVLLQAFYSLGIDDRVWDHSTFSKNRDRLLRATSPPNSWLT